MYALGITDLRWHAQLLDDPARAPINFWTPTPWGVRLRPGIRWFFMLKAPVRRIGGFGILARYEDATVSEAWARFGRANGAVTEADLRERVTSYAAKRSGQPVPADPTIGCVLLEDCVFLPAALQPLPSDLGISFPTQIVKYKSFPGELALPFEAELPDARAPFTLVACGDTQTELRRIRKRVGQPAFRSRVLDAYGDTCAFTGTRCREALEAAHIQPFTSLASNHVQNGLALRRDVHALFDAGLLTISAEGRVLAGHALAGTEYAQLAGSPVRLPARAADHPSPAAVDLHRTTMFKAAR